MPATSLGEIIAERILTLPDEGLTLRVQLGKPEEVADGEYFRCPFTILGVEDQQVRYAPGSDGFQALIHALRIIAIEISLRNQSYSGRLQWDGNCDLGFPEWESGTTPSFSSPV